MDISQFDHGTLEGWRREALAFERSGELFAAYDTAVRGLAAYPRDVWLKHRAVLALVRAGATAVAERKFAEFGLDRIAEDDICALQARILKDKALVQSGPRRRRMLEDAAEAYRRIFRRSGNTYPGVNAASLLLLAGRTGAAIRLGRKVLSLLEPVPAHPAELDYYEIATRIEALLVVGDVKAAEALTPLASAACAKNFGAVAGTIRQLELVVDAKGFDRSVLAGFAIPRVIHYTGHMIAAPGRKGRFPAEAGAAASRRIAAYLDRTPVGWAYGSLACGADILFVEAMLQRGVQVVVVLPFNKDEFIDISVRPGGEAWVGRFEECFRRTEIRYATEDAYLGDAKLFAYAGRLAMGLAALRARHLHTRVEQVAIWDFGRADGPAGTAIDVLAWRRSGRRTAVIAPGLESGSTAARASRKGTPNRRTRVPARSVTRHPCALLFGDIKGFGKLTDAGIPGFVKHVRGGMARVIDRFGRRVAFKNTWGDAIFLVFRDVQTAARCALDLQDMATDIDYARLGLPPDMALRIGGHLGPVFEGQDPVRRVRDFFGAHVSRAARVEPVTPPGCVYVTESFAAALAMDGDAPFECEYVGLTAAAKTYGIMRMFLLRRAARSPCR